MALARWSVLILDASGRRMALARRGAIDAGLAIDGASPGAVPTIVAVAADRLSAVGRPAKATVLVYGLADAAPLPEAVHGRLPMPHECEAFAQALRRHIPPSCATLERLAETFGVAEISALTMRLHDQLAAAVLGGAMLTPMQHHQLAGFAGMLGFDAVHAASQRLSTGCMSALLDFTDSARAALRAIEHNPLFCPTCKTLV